MDQDLKDTIKKLEEAKSKQEKIERIIILLSGLLIIIIFSIIGINIYSNKEETVSEPEINIVAKNETEKETQKKSETQLEQKQTDKQPEKVPQKVEKQNTPPPKPEVKKQPETNTKLTANKTEKKEEKPVKTVKEEKKKAVPPFKSGYYIQAGAFTTRKKAEKLLNTLNLKNARIRKEGQLYKVLIGEFKNRKEAYSFMKKIGIKGFIRKI
ncbi:SPOR domain-containing protein [Persephonella sp.]